MLYDMGGADDKVKIIGSCVVGNFFEVIWLSEPAFQRRAAGVVYAG